MGRRLFALLAAALAVATPASAAAPQVPARAWIVVDGTTGDVLGQHAADRRVPIASITKLMTVLVALEHARPSERVTVAPAAAAVGESSIHLRAGERLTVGDLVDAALIQSANDAAWALAAHVGRGSVPRFVALMNARARRLGLARTRFTRPDGLDAPGHVSTARDVTLLARAAMRRPEVRRAVRLRSERVAGRTLHTWNDLLGRVRGVVGVKTGHTGAAGWSQVAAVRRPGLTIYATVLGSPGRSVRNGALERLIAWGLSRYRLARVIDDRRVYARAQAPYGRGAVPLVAAGSVTRLVRAGRPLVERVVAARGVDLPVRRGARLGEVRVYDGTRLLGRRPLVAARTVERPGRLVRARWLARETVHDLWEAVT